MQKIICFLLSVLLIFLCGCTQEDVTPTTAPTEPSEPSEPLLIRGNKVFTDAFFEDVVEITAYGCMNAVDKEHMGPVVKALQFLTLMESDLYLSYVDENGEPLCGPGWLAFKKSDGTTLSFITTNAIMTLSDGSLSYYIIGDNLNLILREAFERALSDNNE